MQNFFKKYFVAGALVLAPIAITAWILKGFILWCENLVIGFLPSSWHPITFWGYSIPGVGLFLTLLLIFLTGVLTRLYLGRKLLAIGDALINKIPFGRGIYSSTKQLLNTIVSTRGNKFHQVVLVEFPKPGNFMLGFVTGETGELICKHLNQKTLNVFVPTAPNPTSGFLIVMAEENVTPVDISPEKAFKFIVSGGSLHT